MKLLFESESELGMGFLQACYDFESRYYWNYYPHQTVAKWQETLFDEWLNNLIEGSWEVTDMDTYDIGDC